MRDVPFAMRGVPFGLGAGTDQQADKAQDAGGAKLSQNRESLNEKLFLSLTKTVFAKLDNRLG